MSLTPNIPGGIIDVHAHCFTGVEHAHEVLPQLEKLRSAGFSHLAVAGLVNTRLDSSEIRGLIPEYVENRGDALFYEVEHLLEYARLSEGFIIPMVDTRHLWGDVASMLSDYLGKGFRFIKGIYLPDDQNDIGVRGGPATFGITLKEYQRREWEIFDYAEKNELPLLYHVDARRYGDALSALLADFPRVKVNFPHLGIGRKSFSKFLDRHPNICTDIAGLISFINRDPASYRDFIIHYQDRICFGSDCMLHHAEESIDYLEAVLSLDLPEEVLFKVFSANPKAFLGAAIPASS
jgi:hypothetical protein